MKWKSDVNYSLTGKRTAIVGALEEAGGAYLLWASVKFVVFTQETR